MKKDINNLMKKMGVDAIFAYGKTSKNPVMYYLLNGANISGYYIKKRGKPAYVVHNILEREIAQKSGHRLISLSRFNLRKIYERYPDRIKAESYFMKKVLDDLKIKGKVAFYGNVKRGYGYHNLRQLLKFNRNIKVFYDSKKDLISRARETKDKEEVESIKKAGRAVVQAFKKMIQEVRAMKLRKNAIMKDTKKKLRIGDLRQMLALNLFEKGYVSTEGMIVAQGRDAGVPHNAGKDREIVRPGRTIVFDIYPQEEGGGYYFDFTRTICFGYAPEKIKEVYKIVKDAQDLIFESIKVGKRHTVIERKLCTFFEKHGHPTFLSNRKTEVGYCHSLGHGLGLNVHESPSFGLTKTNQDRIQRGYVFTVEPGLYYPDQGFGIRLEDVVYINPRGRIENLTKCPRNLVVRL